MLAAEQNSVTKLTKLNIKCYIQFIIFKICLNKALIYSIAKVSFLTDIIITNSSTAQASILNNVIIITIVIIEQLLLLFRLSTAKAYLAFCSAYYAMLASNFNGIEWTTKR